MVDNEEQKNNSIQGKPEKRVSLLLPVIVAAVIFVAMVVAIVIAGMTDNREFIVKEDDFTRCFQIESLEINNNITIKGWCFTLEEDTSVVEDNKTLSELEIYLIDINDETKLIKLNTQSRIPREDVNDYFLCEYDYTFCGFYAETSIENIDTYKNVYEVALCDDKTSEVLVKTGVYVSEGKLVEYNPVNFKALSVQNTDLEEIISNGVLRTYDVYEDIYVYQYDDLLYWIAGPDYEFASNMDTYLQFHLYTTQIDKLPENRIDNGYFWDNQSDFFEKYEITDSIETGIYRVCVRELPDAYSIHSISTGYYNDGNWDWTKTFRPYYDFK